MPSVLTRTTLVSYRGMGKRKDAKKKRPGSRTTIANSALEMTGLVHSGGAGSRSVVVLLVFSSEQYSLSRERVDALENVAEKTAIAS